MKNLIHMSGDEFKKFMDSFDVIISDCDGVLWNPEPIAGVEETIKNLKNVDKTIYFVTNNSIKSLYESKFKMIKVDLDQNNLINPTMTLIRYLKDIKFEKKIYCIACEAIVETMRDANIDCVSGPNDCEEKIPSLLACIKDDEDIGAVYVDMDINVSYVKIMKALNLLKRKDVLYLVGASEKIIPFSSNKYILGPQNFFNIITEYSGRKPAVLGKPGDYLKEMTLKQFNIVDPKRVIFVGDSLESDIQFAKSCGFQSLLVLSGITSDEDAQCIKDEAQIPDYYITSFGDLFKNRQS